MPTGIAVAPDGSIYIAETNKHVIRRVDINGKITTIAGIRGSGGFSGDGGPATSAKLNQPRGLALDKNGNLYIADTYNHRIRMIAPDGTISTVAGSGATGPSATGFAGDGGPATGAKMYTPYHVNTGADGSLLIADTGNNRIRLVRPDGVIETIAGAGTDTKDGALAYTTNTDRAYAAGMFLPNGESLIPLGTSQIGRVTSANPSFNALDMTIPSDDGFALYRFDVNGRHLSTLNALTGAVIHTFGYDAGNRLTTITDADGNVTTVQRDGTGNPTGIISPYGVRTALSVNSSGYLSSITNPLGGSNSFTYTADGLMTSMRDPNGGVYTFTWDAMGLLLKDQNPAGGYLALSRVQADLTGENYTVTATTAEGRSTVRTRERTTDGGERLTTTDPSGAVTVTVDGSDGVSTVTSPDGTVKTVALGPDSRYGMNSPIVKSASIKSPSGLTTTMSTTRTVTLSNSADPLTLTSMSDAVTVNGKTTRTSFDKASMTITTTTPMGKAAKRAIDQQS